MEIDDNNSVKTSDSDGSSDNLSMDEVKEEELKKVIHSLEVNISKNEYHYDSHVELITALKKILDLDKLRVARERMSKLFPLPSNMWLDWLEDEIKIATSNDEKLKIVELFERALKDYLSVDIWLEYVQFNIGLQADVEDPMLTFEEVRKLFERALSSAGLHVTKGSILWIAYIEFELTILALIEKKGEAEVVESQVKKIANLFRRQLSVPLLDIDETYERAKSWISENLKDFDLQQLESVYNKSKQSLKELEEFENKLISEPEQFRDYIEHEKSKEGNPARVQCLYERLLTDFCLNEQLWLEYADYLDKVIRNGSEATNVLERAIRNCPWSSTICTVFMRLVEKYNNSHERINGIMEQSFTLGFQQSSDFRAIWIAYLEYMRRRLDADEISKEEEDKRLKELQKAFEKAVGHLNQLGDDDPNQTILQFWSRIEASYGKNMEKCRDLWSQIFSDSASKTAAMFLEYISLEKMYGDSKHLRKLYLRALQQTHDWPESIYNSWLNFERDEGTLENYEYCIEKCEARLKQVEERRAKLRKEQELREDRAPRSTKTDLKGKWEKLGKNDGEKRVALKRKNQKQDSNEEASQTKVAKKEEEQQRTEDIVEKLLNEEKPKNHGETIKHDPSKDHRTVFISNLGYTTTEETIRENFSPIGTITDLRLVKDFKGRSKGFCYIEFDKTETALEALKMDRKLIDNRPMYVSKCDPDRETRTKGFRFSTNLEKNKLFIKGLNLKTTIDDLKALFEPFGALKDVRLVTYRNGHSKGLAYVEFQNESAAAQAVLKTDGTELQEKTISVAISNPPGRKQTDEGIKVVESLGGGARGQFGPRGRGRVQISLVPRSIQLNQSNNVNTKSMENLSINSPAAAINR